MRGVSGATVPPDRKAALGIEIEQHDPLACTLGKRTHVDRAGSLPSAALAGEECDDSHLCNYDWSALCLQE
jgi:hypothetical protein